jgi:hypothetical protein
MKIRFDSRLLFLLASVILFAISLTQDCFYIDREDRDAYALGLGLLLIGWLGVLVGVFAWLANPLLMIAWILTLLGRHRLVAVGCALAAITFSLSFLLHDDIMANEVGGRSAITEIAPGYWLWNLSILCVIFAALLIKEPITPVEIWDGDAHLSQPHQQLDDRS